MIFRRAVNSTEKYQSADGLTQVVIQPAATTNLQEILFHPTNQHLVAQNETEVFSNGTSKVLVAEVDLVTEATEIQKTSETTSPVSTTTSSDQAAPKSPTSTIQVLKAIPSTVVAGTTESTTTLADLSTKSINTPNSTPHVAIVTPAVSEVVNATSRPTTTAEPESESKEIRDKVKEVEAEPVILTVGV